MAKAPSAPPLFNPTLDGETYIKAREVSAGLDIYTLEAEWKEQVAETGKIPKDPDRAFIDFCERKAALQVQE